MSKEQSWMPGDVYFGGPEVPLPDWRAEASPSDEDDDAPLSEEERQAMIKVLGFDPSELFEEKPVQKPPTVPPSPFLKSLFDHKAMDEGKYTEEDKAEARKMREEAFDSSKAAQDKYSKLYQARVTDRRLEMAQHDMDNANHRAKIAGSWFNHVVHDYPLPAGFSKPNG